MPLILKYLIVYALSGVKFIFGPTLGLTYGLSMIATIILSLLGMMTTVYLLSYFGAEIRGLTKRLFGRKKNNKVFTSKSRRIVKVWLKWGVPGIAFFTPILLSPIGGVIIANALGGKKKDIIKWMWIFGSAWSVILVLLSRYAEGLLKDLMII